MYQSVVENHNALKHPLERRQQFPKIARNLKYFYATGPWDVTRRKTLFVETCECFKSVVSELIHTHPKDGH